ncbi:MAG: hypothetical protein WA672_06700 [Candidatus Angelobacter sp.]
MGLRNREFVWVGDGQDGAAGRRHQRRNHAGAWTGVATTKAIMKVLPKCRIILFSGQAASVDLLAKARAESYIFEVLPKPINPDKLLEKLKN